MAGPASRAFIHRAILAVSTLMVFPTTPKASGPLPAFVEPTSAVSQTPEVDANERVLAVVNTFLDRLGRQRIYALAPLFAENAVIITARERSMGYETEVESASSWLTRMSEAPNPEPFEERIFNPRVTIESGHLATVRADFEIVRRGIRESSGVDIFTLIRKPDDWKVASIAYTSIPSR